MMATYEALIGAWSRTHPIADVVSPPEGYVEILYLRNGRSNSCVGGGIILPRSPS